MTSCDRLDHRYQINSDCQARQRPESSMEKTDGMPRPHPSLPMAPPLGTPPPPLPPHPPQHMIPPPLPHSPPLPPPPPNQSHQRELQPPLPAVPEPSSDIDDKRRTTAETSKSVSGADMSQKLDPSGEVMKEGNEKERGREFGAKIKMSFGSKGGALGKRPGGMISMKLKPQSVPDAKKTKLEAAVPSKPSSKLVAQVFGSDSEEEEEMPPEAKLRMRNIGKNTPTSAGPNSFNKTQRGFSDPKSAQAWRQTD